MIETSNVRRPSSATASLPRGPESVSRAPRPSWAWPSPPPGSGTRPPSRPRRSPTSRASARCPPRRPRATPRPRRRPRSRRRRPSSLIDEAKAKIAKLQSCAGQHGRAGGHAQSACHHQGEIPQGAPVPRLFPAHPRGAARDHRLHTPGLRRRDALGLPVHPRAAGVPQVQHQAGDGTAQFARSRRQAQGSGQGRDGIRRPRDPAGRPPPALPLRPGEGGGQARRQGRLDPPREMEEPPGPDRTRPPTGPRDRPPAPLYPRPGATSTWGRTMAGPTSWSSAASRRPGCSTPARRVPTAARSARSARSNRRPDDHHAGIHRTSRLNPDPEHDEFAFQAPKPARSRMGPR